MCKMIQIQQVGKNLTKIQMNLVMKPPQSCSCSFEHIISCQRCTIRNGWLTAGIQCDGQKYGSTLAACAVTSRQTYHPLFQFKIQLINANGLQLTMLLKYKIAFFWCSIFFFICLQISGKAQPANLFCTSVWRNTYGSTLAYYKIGLELPQ